MRTTREGYYTYEEAGKELDRSALTIRQAVYKGVLHPVKFRHDQLKYIPADEVQWFRGKEFTLVNAELFQLMKENLDPQNKTLFRSREGLDNAMEQAKEVLDSPEKSAGFITLMFMTSLGMKGLRKEYAHQATLHWIKLVQLTENGPAICQELAPALVECFNDIHKEWKTNLSSENKRILNETLDALLYPNIEEQEPSPIPA